MHKPVVKLYYDKLDNIDIVVFDFVFDNKVKETIKAIEGTIWNSKLKFWYLSLEKFKLTTVSNSLRDVAYIDYSSLITRNRTQYKEKQKRTHGIPKEKIEMKNSVLIEKYMRSGR
jgi:hypothetical protein